MIEGVKQGYFDNKKILEHARELEKQIIASRAEGSLKNAWLSYNDTFDDDQDAVLDTIHAAFMKNIHQVSPVYLDRTLRLFKHLGRGSQACLSL